MKSALGWGYVAYFVVAIALAVITGIWSEMTPFKLVIWIIYAAFAAIASELIVGISAMYSGWFPGFATALIFLLVGMLIGFPSMPLAVLVAYTAATGPAFSDMAYDLKCGYILRGYGKDPELEKSRKKTAVYFRNCRIYSCICYGGSSCADVLLAGAVRTGRCDLCSYD